MKTKTKLKPIAASLLFFSVNAYAAYPVFDASLNAAFNSWAGSWAGAQASLMVTLNNIGSAINTSSQQISSAIQSASEAERNLAVKQAYNDRLLEARNTTKVPASICVESASGGSSPAAAGATRNRTSIEGGGGGAGLSTLNDASNLLVNGPSQPVDIAAFQTASASSQFCSPADFDNYGGSKVCPTVNNEMPAADKRISSVLDGAGPYGKTADGTFTQEQADVARLYVRNATRRNISQGIEAAEADTAAGQRYLGLLTQYDAMVSAAEQPAINAIANRMPVPETANFISDALETPSANSYWNATASEEAKRTGSVSYRELEQFEVGRRYSNVAYGQDLQAMTDNNLLREMIRVQSLNSHLMLGIKDQLEQNNIIAGQGLAASARQEYEPILQAQLQQIYSR